MVRVIGARHSWNPGIASDDALLDRLPAEGVDLLHLASEMVIDAVIQPEDLRSELIKRFALAEGRDRSFTERRIPITPA